ncbi:MAG: insulinase family protein [Chloroflexi bacterium]|nr:insulinase family protein [Chloroflexota bacterium]
MFSKTTLPNGLRVVSSPMPETRSVSISVFVGTGSRYERPEEAGVSHFIEHMLFKGAERHPTAKDISEAIEGVGGVMNAGTEREVTVYWLKVASLHFQMALDLLVDMLRNSKFRPADCKREQQVIVEELSATEDSPQQKVDFLIDELLWPDQPLGRDVGGTKESVMGLTREVSVSYLGLQYVPNNVVVSVAGDITHDQVVEAVAKRLGDRLSGEPRPWFPAVDGQRAPRVKVESRKTEQAHLCLALRGISTLHPDRYTLGLLNAVLGEGMSSRLFLELREKKGLCYEVASGVSHYMDAGALSVYAGVDPKKIDQALGGILEQIYKLEDRVPEREVTKAKEMSKGRLLLRMEDSHAVSGWMGVQELLLGRIRTVDEVVDIIDAVTPRDMQRVAKQLLRPDQFNLAVVGPYRSEGRFLKALGT